MDNNEANEKRIDSKTLEKSLDKWQEAVLGKALSLGASTPRSLNGIKLDTSLS